MSDMLDVAPTLPRYGAEAEDALLRGRQPGRGEFLGGSVAEGWWGTTTATGAELGAASAEGAREPQPIGQTEWRYHPLWREGIAWDERMTEGRAAAQARVYDENRYRRAMMDARDAGAFETVLGFGGQLLGSIPDPVNFLPIAGPLARLARVGEASAEAGLAARMLGGAARTLERPGVAGSAIRGTVDAVGGNIAAAPIIYGIQERFGDEVTFDRVLADLSIGALIGAGFGTAGGLIGRARESMDQRAAVRIMDSIARDIAAGRAPEIPGRMAAAAVEDAVIRSAPPEVSALLPEAGRLADLPTRADGAPLTREEFDARLDEILRDERVVGYHGTDQRIDKFDPDQTRLGRGVFFSDKPDLANRFAMGKATDSDPIRLPEDDDFLPTMREFFGKARMVEIEAQHAEMKRLEAEAERVERSAPEAAPEVLAAWDAYRAQWRKLVDAGLEAGAMELGAPQVYRAKLRLGKTLEYEFKDGFDWDEEAAAIARARAEGYDSVTFTSRGQKFYAMLGEGGIAFHSNLLEIAFSRASKISASIAEARDAAYRWYADAVAMRRDLDRLAATRATAPIEAAPVKPDAEAKASDKPGLSDPETTAALAEIETLRAEGRISAGDDAVLKAGDEAATELRGIAKGLEGAAACLLRGAA